MCRAISGNVQLMMSLATNMLTQKIELIVCEKLRMARKNIQYPIQFLYLEKRIICIDKKGSWPHGPIFHYHFPLGVIFNDVVTGVVGVS